MIEQYFMINDIIEFIANGKLERLLWISDDYIYCITMDVLSDTMDFKQRNIAEMTKDLKEGNIKIRDKEKDPTFRIVKKEEVCDTGKALWDKSIKIVRFLTAPENIPYIFYRKYRGQLVKKAVEEFKVGYKAVYKYLRVFLKSGMDENSLCSKFDGCGAKGKPRKILVKKLGRPLSKSYLTGQNDGILVSEEIESIFKISLTRYFYNEKKRKLTKAYRLMKDEFFTERVEIDGYFVYQPLPKEKIPSLRQFRYYYYNHRDPIKETKKRKGEKEYDLNFRAILSNSRSETLGPGFRYQIDSTVADVYLVSSIYRNSIIGRPIVYLATDVFSSIIAGIHVCLEGPSWTEMSSLIHNCLTSKKEYCERFGIKINEEDWPVRGIAEVLLADGGETIGTVMENAIGGIRIMAENAPSGRGDAKGIVEQYFNILNIDIRDWSPGAVKKEFNEQRGKRDYRLDAKLDIYQFTQLIIYAVLNYNKRLLREYRLSQEMINAGINPRPIELWNWGMVNRTGRLRTLTDEQIKLNLMRRKRVSVTPEGIKFDGDLLYTSPKALAENWFSQARIDGCWPIDVAFDDRDMSVIYRLDKESDDFEICTLKEECYLFKNKSYKEVLDYRFNCNVRNYEMTDEINQSNFDMDKNYKRIVGEAESMAVETTISQSKRIKDINKNRKEESILVNKNNSLTFGKDTSLEINSDNDDKEEYSSKTVSIRKIREMRERKRSNG